MIQIILFLIVIIIPEANDNPKSPHKEIFRKRTPVILFYGPPDTYPLE